MFLKISRYLDMLLTSLDTKNYCPRLNGLGDIAIIANPIFLGHPVYSIYPFLTSEDIWLARTALRR